MHDLPQKTWNDAYELATAIEEHILCGHRRVVLSPSTALWIARQIQNACRDRKTVIRKPDRRLEVDMFADGSRVMHVDDKGDIVEILAWAKNSVVARAAFEEICRREPTYSLHQRRGAWVEADRMVTRVQRGSAVTGDNDSNGLT